MVHVLTHAKVVQREHKAAVSGHLRLTLGTGNLWLV